MNEERVPSLRRAARAVWHYLRDWRNLIGHAIVGVALLAAAIWVPIPPALKLIALAAIIAINLLRQKKKPRRS